MPNQLRAPTRHGDILLDPAGSLADVVRANEAQLLSEELWGRPLATLRNEARAEISQRAMAYTDDLVGSESVAFRSMKERSISARMTTLPTPYWIIGGHQPELFHPGVWVKNAVVSGLATPLGGVGLNLVVDNDVCTGSSVRVPCGPNSPGMESLDWDVLRPQSPWEERPQPEAETFASFGERCRDHLRPWGIEPLAAGQDWGASPERGVVDRLVQLRARFERSVGIENLELKVSDLADTRCFRLFLWGALRNAQTLLAAYNSALTDYRSLHHIRSRSHPVPALERAAESVETPFWVWREGEAQRCRLFVQANGTGVLRLHDGRREMGAITATSEADALSQLQDLRTQGWKIRPRALTLTLFCRVCLGSVFVHGIGGSKYDELTDALMPRWLGLNPPQIIVATATLRLFEEFAGPPLEPELARRRQELRWIRWNPELVRAESAALESVVLRSAEKSALLASALDPATRHARLQSVNAALRAELGEHEQHVRLDLQQRLSTLPHQQFLHSREFAAILFPKEAIRDLFLQAMDGVQSSERD